MSDMSIPHEARLKYLERRQDDFEKCQKAIVEKNFELLAKIGHQIKGNAVTFGYEDLESIAINLEESALKKDLEKLSLILNDFLLFLKKHNHL